MGPFTPVDIGGYKYAIEITDEHTGQEFRHYFMEIGIIQEFAATNTL